MEQGIQKDVFLNQLAFLRARGIGSGKHVTAGR